jgi:hypothetical protein
MNIKLKGMKMADYITASFETLLGQASDTAAIYLYRAKSEIDKVFGDGYAIENPQLVAAFINAAASDMNATTNAKVSGAVLQEIAKSLSDIADAISNHSAT